MSKFWVAIISVFVLVGVAYASDVTVQSAGTYVAQASSINFTGGPAVTANAAGGVDVAFATETGNKTVTGNLTVTGTIVDASIYTKAAGTYPQRLATIGADGTIYGTRSVLVDVGIYTASAGTGGSKSLRISADGTIYGF